MATVAKPVQLTAVRVEGESSIGRSYSSGQNKSIPGLGAKRRLLRTKSFNPYPEGKSPVLESLTMVPVNASTATREEILAYFHNTWHLTDTIFDALRDDSVFYMVPDKLRRPLIFYFAHPAALYINKMHQAGLVDHVHPYHQKLFETGVDEMSWDDMDEMQDEDFAWPDVSETMAFRDAVKASVEALIARMPVPSEGHPITQASPYWALIMAFEHERIHLETSSVLMRQLPVDAVVAPPGWRTAPTYAPSPDAAPHNHLVHTHEHTVVLGKPVDYPSFGWDNEYGNRVVDVPGFQASAFTVTNAEFLPFVRAGGYNDKQWWVSATGDDEGWRWKSFRNATHPSFWVATSHPDMLQYHGGKPGFPYQKDDGHASLPHEDGWHYRAQYHLMAMPWDWPVEVNYLEASAFLRWKAAQESAASGVSVTYRMPTEAEYHVIRGDPSPWPEATVGRDLALAGETTGEGKEGAKANGAVVPMPLSNHPSLAAAARDAAKSDILLQPAAPGNTNMRWGSSTPVDYYQPSSTGFYDAHGNVWQWVEDHFAPLPGFEIHYMYDDFSTPCFDGWHTMILGGSWVSTGDLASSYARYHFRRHFFQHLGFRYVKVVGKAEEYPGAATVANLWEGGTAVSKEITDGYAAGKDKLAFPTVLAAPDSALQYPTNLAHLVSKAYSAHSLGAASSSSPSTAALPPAGTASVLHLGCGVGGATFELARDFGKVVGVDIREPSIRHARVLQHHGQLEYERVREGVLTDRTLVRTPAGVDRARVSFVLADAQDKALVEEAGSLVQDGKYEVVVVDSLLTRVRQPMNLLAVAGALVRPGGLLVVVSTNDWSPLHTPRNGWLGGFKMNGEDQTTAVMLRYALRPKSNNGGRGVADAGYALVESCDLSRLTRAHARRFTLDVLQATVWRRNA